MLYDSDKMTDVDEPGAVVLLLSLLHNAMSDWRLLHSLLQLLIKVEHLLIMYVCVPELTIQT